MQAVMVMGCESRVAVVVGVGVQDGILGQVKELTQRLLQDADWLVWTHALHCFRNFAKYTHHDVCNARL
jgi:hypothetical protein